MSVLADLVGVSTTHTGTSGPISLGAALTQHRTFAAANAAGQLPTGSIVSYTIFNGNDAETCTGVYNSAANTLTRLTRTSTTGSALNLTGTSEVILTANAGDFLENEFRLPPRSGAWFGDFSDVGSGAILIANLIHYVPIIVSEGTTIDRLAIWMQGGGAGFNARLGIYRPGVNRLPDTLIAECATPVALSGFGRREGTFSTNPRLERGLYWGASLPDSGTPQCKTIGVAAQFLLRHSIGNADNYAGLTRAHVIQNGSYAAGLPANASGLVVQEGFMPLIMARAA